MAKRRGKKTAVIRKEKVTEVDVSHSDLALLEKRVEQLEQRLDRIVDAVDKSKTLKNL